MKNRNWLLAASLFLSWTMTGAQAETILIRNATVMTVTKGTVQNGSVLIENGKIAAIGKNVSAPADATVVDANRKVSDSRHYRLPLAYSGGRRRE